MFGSQEIWTNYSGRSMGPMTSHGWFSTEVRGAREGAGNIPSLQLAVGPLKIGGWETTFLLGYGLFSGYVSFRDRKQFLICRETVFK